MKAILSGIYGILLTIDGFIYNVIAGLFKVFNYLARVNLFSQNDYQQIVNNIYTVLGVVMLFVLAYSLLKAVINPENFSKGEQSFPKLVQNVVISLIIIAVLPTVFSVAFNIQSAVLKQDTIPKIILGDKFDTNDGIYADPGRNIAYHTFNAFFHENYAYCESEGKNLEACREEIESNHWWVFGDPVSLADISNTMLNSKDFSFVSYSQFSNEVAEGRIDYMLIISTIAGIFVGYVLICFCIDMALRVIKLMYFQIVAPIPVVCRIIPGGKMKDVFPDWVKKTISTFVEVFIRIAVLYLGIFLLDIIIAKFSDITSIGSGDLELNLLQLSIVKVLLIMGVILFIRQAPKLIGDMFHLDSGSMKLGLMDKLAMGGALTAASAAGALATQAGRNAVSAGQKFKKARENGKLGVGAVIGGIGSTVAGGVSAGVRAGWAGKGAKNFKDVRSAASAGAQAAGARKAKREAYKQSHSSGVDGPLGSLQTLGNVGLGHIIDARDSVGEYFGFNSLDDLKKERDAADELAGIYSKMTDKIADDAEVTRLTGALDSEMKREISATVFDKNGYKRALTAKFRELRNAGHSVDEANALAKSQISQSSFVRARSQEERVAAEEARTRRIQTLRDQIDFAKMVAVNKELAKGDSSKLAALAETYNTKRDAVSNYSWASQLREMGTINLDPAFVQSVLYGDPEAVSASDPTKSAISEAWDSFKGDQSRSGFLADNKALKAQSGNVSRLIAKKIEETKAKEGK